MVVCQMVWKSCHTLSIRTLFSPSFVTRREEKVCRVCVYASICRSLSFSVCGVISVNV